MQKLKIIFAGTPIFSVPILQAILDANHDVCAVYTQPDRPSGRGLKIIESPVKQFAKHNGLPLQQPKTLKTEEVQTQLKNYQADIMIVAAYGLILPQEVLDATKLGCVNVHASLLPRWRGAAPIQRAILAGDTETGISVMKMETGLDTGPVFSVSPCVIQPRDTAKTLYDKLSLLGAKTLMDCLDKIVLGTLTPTTQDDEKATYANKIEKAEAHIDWKNSAKTIERTIRAFNPYPIAFSFIDDLRVKFWHAKVIEGHVTDEPGTIINVAKEIIDIATGQDILRVLKLQFPGGRQVSIREALNSKRDMLKQGKQFS